MLLGLLADYSGRKKRTLDPCGPLSIQIHPRDPVCLCSSTASLVPISLGSNPGAATYWLYDLGQVTSLLYASIFSHL